MTEKASSIQIAGDHYRKFAIQPSEFCQRNGLGWCESNVVKYVSRWRDKNGEQDIDKAIHYLQLLKEWEFPKPDEYPLVPHTTDIHVLGTVASPCTKCVTYRCADRDKIPSDQCAKFEGLGNVPTWDELTKEAMAAKTPTPLSLCAVCDLDDTCPTYPQETQHCAGFRDKVEREALDLTLPSYALPCTAGEAHAKYLEECEEWGNCIAGSMESLIEAWDIRQAAQTWDAVSQSAISTMALATAGNRLAEYYNHGEDVMKAKRIMLIKLAARHRYSDADCARILADV